MGPRITMLQRQVLTKMRSGYKATVPHKGRVANLYRLNNCDDHIPVYRTVVLALLRYGLIEVHEEDQHETDYIAAAEDSRPLPGVFRGRPGTGPSYRRSDTALDPKACLEDVQHDYESENFADMSRSLIRYREWRYRGGYEPIMDDGTRGDQFVRRLMEDFMGGSLPPPGVRS